MDLLCSDSLVLRFFLFWDAGFHLLLSFFSPDNIASVPFNFPSSQNERARFWRNGHDCVSRSLPGIVAQRVGLHECMACILHSEAGGLYTLGG